MTGHDSGILARAFSRAPVLALILTLISISALTLTLTFASISICSGFEVSPANPAPGEEIVIKGTAAPGEMVKLRSSFQMDLPVAGGRYEYQTSVEIPQKPNRFTVTAKNVLDLNAGVKMLIWITRRFEASGGVATISQSDVPPGRYNLKMFGEAAPGASTVSVKVEADTSVKADSGGVYSLAIDTSGIPAGDYRIESGGDSRTVRIGPPAAGASLASTGSGDGDNDSDDSSTGNPSASSATPGPSPAAITPQVIKWYAGKLGLDPDDPAQYDQAEKSLRTRIKGDYWRVIAFGQPLTEEAGSCEEDYCLVRGTDACTACKEKDSLNGLEGSAVKSPAIKEPQKDANFTSTAAAAMPAGAPISGSSNEKGKGFIGEVMKWIGRG